MRLLLPNKVYNKVTDINLTELRQLGITGLLLDLDNTLVKWDSEEMDPEFMVWIEQVKALGFKLCLVSNGKPQRVQRFAQLFNIPAVIKAFKPKRTPFRRALELLKLDRKQVAMIGDQLFTDVLGANRLGIYTILISPLGKNELRTTKFMRRLEQRMLRRFVNKGLLNPEIISTRNGGTK